MSYGHGNGYGGGYGRPPQQQGPHGYGPPGQHGQHGHGQHGHGQHGHGQHGYGPQPYGQAPNVYTPQRNVYTPPGMGWDGEDIAGKESTRRKVGLALWILGIVVGILLNILFTLAEVLLSSSPSKMANAIVMGAIFAFPPLVVYITVPKILDRFDPEPWWSLAMAFAWGAIVATGFAGMINTGVAIVFTQSYGKQTGELVSAAVSAPISEELFKGMAVLGFFYFLRREFDGIVDGIIYGILCGLGFAAVENVSYYARAAVQGQDTLAGTFVLRGVFTPWLHPLFTSMTGIGFGLARESSNKYVRGLAPLGGLMVGMSLHAMWNFLPTALGSEMTGGVFVVWLFVWLLFVAAFFGIIIALVVRKGRTIRDHLKDEVLLGNMTQDDVALVTSPFGRLTCTLSWRGGPGRSFIAAASKLALSKWHTARAMKGQKRTMSADFIAPLRQQMRQHRAEMLARAPR
ncbi:MAG: PrsW family intramembrane metalloprotease [Polyangiaceae bacterium]